MARKDIKVDAVYDIETERWDTFVVGGIRWANGDYDEFDHTREEEMASALLSMRGSIAAHYGGGFDHKWLLDWAAKRGMQGTIAAAGSRIVFAKIGTVNLIDTFAIAPMSLADFTEGLGVAKQALDLECLQKPWCEAGCKGYCQIRRGMPEAVRRRVCEYLEKDCESLWLAVEALREFARVADLDLSKTIGSSAWKHAQRFLSLPDADLAVDEHAAAREGYYGGRVQVLRHGFVAGCFEHDVRSMYPWALNSNALPVGNHGLSFGLLAKEALAAGLPGIYDCTVSVPDSFIPPLPMRTKKRIYYPVGTFRGQWALPELRYAQSLGAEVIRTHKAVTWEKERVLFTDWTQRIFHVRHHEAGGADSPLGVFAKFYANSLTGKLGMNPERYKYHLNPDDIKTCTTPKECGNECKGKCGSYGQISEYIWRERTFSLSACMHVHWAAYLTAYSRIRLHSQLVSSGEDDACYCDTDSVFSTLPRTWEVGEGLGQFEFKGYWRNMTFVAPKVYEGDKADGKHKIKAKGLPKGIVKGMERLELGKQFAAEGIAGFTSTRGKDKFFRRSKVKRELRARLGDRLLVKKGRWEGETRPMTVAEALADSKKR